jgi:hypothetical protein
VVRSDPTPYEPDAPKYDQPSPSVRAGAPGETAGAGPDSGWSRAKQLKETEQFNDD